MTKLNRSKKHLPSIPTFFYTENKQDWAKLKNLIDSGRVLYINDTYKDQLKEFFEITNPDLVFTKSLNEKFNQFLKKSVAKTPLQFQGSWVYFPWNGTINHILSEKEYFIVRTARNKNLILPKEQQKFYDAKIGIAGLSVGNSVALAIILQGGAKNIKLADHDSLALSNINRIRTGVQNLGIPKVELTARQIYEINPYAKIEIFSEGLNKNNAANFIKNLDVMIDEIDNLAIKYLIRIYAKKYRIPVVMAADNGDNGIIDIERYDKYSKLKYFHNHLDGFSYKKLVSLNKQETARVITKLLGIENVTIRMHQSLTQIGKTLASWPQLGGAALLNGSAVAYCVRKIVNNQPIPNSRSTVSLDEKLDPSYNNKNKIAARDAARQKFKIMLGL